MHPCLHRDHSRRVHPCKRPTWENTETILPKFSIFNTLERFTSRQPLDGIVKINQLVVVQHAAAHSLLIEAASWMTPKDLAINFKPEVKP